MALAHCVNNSEKSTQGVKTPCYSGFALSGALKNQFEIMSCNENYDFNHNNFYHNGNNQSLSLRGGSRSNPKLKKLYTKWIASLLSIARNDGNELFSRNDYGREFIFGFWNNFNYGFLFNRKNQQKKFYYCQRFSVGEGEQK